jgi:hypothetical protein
VADFFFVEFYGYIARKALKQSDNSGLDETGIITEDSWYYSMA